jgi:nucleotide-binding universal stress UspA family protein
MHVEYPGTAPRIGLREEAGWSSEIVVRQGDVVGQILEEAAHWRPDLVVLATQGHMDFLDALRGSTTERVQRGVHCPVLAIPVQRNRSRK